MISFGAMSVTVVGFCWDLTRSLLRSRSGRRSGASGDLKMNLNRGNTRVDDKRKQ